jgi:DNA-binding MarR family transcriptional regulator
MHTSTEPQSAPGSEPVTADPTSGRPSGTLAARRLRADDPRLASWRSFLRTHAHIMRRLEQDLAGQSPISLACYDVLVQLTEAPGDRLRMSELADAVLLSRSGLTRLVDRMQRDGLVTREPDPDDARGLYTVLTEQGRNVLREASHVHLAGVQELFVARLSPQELDDLHRTMVRLDPSPAADLPIGEGRCGLD